MIHLVVNDIMIFSSTILGSFQSESLTWKFHSAHTFFRQIIMIREYTDIQRHRKMKNGSLMSFCPVFSIYLDGLINELLSNNKSLFERIFFGDIF